MPFYREKKKKPHTFIRMGVDVLMTLLLLFLTGYQLWGETAHEWAGAGMLLLFIGHHVLNRGWYKGLFKARMSPMRIAQAGINMLLFLAMIAQMYSGIVMSRHVFAFLPIEGGMALARRLHILGAYWGFILMSIHLGLHWNMFLAVGKKRAGFLKSSKVCGIFLFILGLVTALYGAVVFIKRDWVTYLLLHWEKPQRPHPHPIPHYPPRKNRQSKYFPRSSPSLSLCFQEYHQKGLPPCPFFCYFLRFLLCFRKRPEI